ncbi:hypothetical protein Nepgr_025513 [Nepenthes gracilis]|uniref:Polymerase/histidinol phosphatase N-terminal domain-containing protein n=1 Tax=Nepenthes gracilis TaxID=150966 RepID=A0AAD3Y149_NEPGR|nr:hypothetical protein Nepgr_025513 [Nepenthes gracilis]
MMGDGFYAQNTNNSSKNKKKKKKRGGGKKKKMTAEQTRALKSVNEWVYLNRSSSSSSSSSDYDDFIPRSVTYTRASDNVSFEMHSHSTCSDGFLSPKALVEKAHQNGVKVLALTDHDTMSGIPEALEAARKYGIKIIPGVEISTIYSIIGDSASEEPVHILAYYSSCGPVRFEDLEKFLANIRDGRFPRAKSMVSKLNRLKVPLKWEHVMKIAGSGVAPGRLHVARALVEAGYVENLKQAFARYLYDGGPAYSKGSEPSAEEAILLIRETGGLSVLAHPWALKNPVQIIKRLKEAGLHGIEVYRSDGKLAAYSDLADAYGLLKLGGADFHGRGGHDERPLGSVSLPVLAVHEFLKLARPIWCKAIRDILERYADDPSESNLELIVRFNKMRISKGRHCKDLIDLCLSSWLTKEEVQTAEFAATMLKLSHVAVN